MSRVSPPQKKKNPKTNPTNNVVIRGERLSFPRKIIAFYTLVTQQKGLEKEKTIVTNFVC